MELPKCVKQIARKRDTDALDDVFAFFKTFGTDQMEPVLWSMGYFTIDNYKTRKNSAMGMIKSSKLLACFQERPANLEKYCSEDCPYRDPASWFKAVVKHIYLTRGEIPVSRVALIELHSGEVIKSYDRVFDPVNPSQFLEGVAQDVKNWFMENYNLVIPLSAEKMAKILAELIWG